MLSRDVAQSGRAQRSGRWGRWFKSSRPDQKNNKYLAGFQKWKPASFLVPLVCQSSSATDKQALSAWLLRDALILLVLKFKND